MSRFIFLVVGWLLAAGSGMADSMLSGENTRTDVPVYDDALSAAIKPEISGHLMANQLIQQREGPFITTAGYEFSAKSLLLPIGNGSDWSPTIDTVPDLPDVPAKPLYTPVLFVLLIGGVIRALISDTFRKFCMDVFDPLNWAG